MGAAPSRETHRRGIFAVRTPACSSNGGGGGGGSRKQDIVLIPLTKEFFPSPDCPLFVQFHRARCDAAVCYYFRQPGNPGDLSRIPATGTGGGDLYPSREALYRGVVERVEEMLFDTDQEMYEAHVRSTGTSPSSPDLSGDSTSTERRRVLPVLCAVAFLYDPARLAQAAAASVTGTVTPSASLLAAMEQGVALGGSIVNIVGCFGFVPMESAGRRAASHTSVGSSINFSAGSSMPGMTQLLRSSHGGDTASITGQFARMPNTSHRSLGSTCTSPPSYDPNRPASSILPKTAASNYDHFVSLPPPVAAPLASIVFLTKSAGEQNLSRVTFIAASTYCSQLADAGLLPQRAKSHITHMPYRHQFDFPPMDTFSFSSLMTNVPILSFVHEMRCRWGYLGFQTTGGSGAGAGSNHSSRVNSLNNSIHGYSGANASGDCHSEMEMWITEDNMLHGRIRKELAERLCRALAERPEVMGERVDVIPMDKPYWRFRGLVNRYQPPPSPQSEGEETGAYESDVYVMGSAVMEGFDQGDVLRFDSERHVWVADRTIPLEAVVLAAMRPHCRRAREAPPDDDGWVRVPVNETEEAEEENERETPDALPTNETGSANAEEKVGREDHTAHANTTGEMGDGEEKGNNGGKAEDTTDADGTLEESQVQCVHVHEGNFYIYSFELNGTNYYHGTVPDFANPNKRRAQQQNQPQQHHQRCGSLQSGASNSPRLPKEDSATRTGANDGPAVLPSIAAALFAAGHTGADAVGTYLPSRVTSAAIETSWRFMSSLAGYVGRRPVASPLITHEGPSPRRQPTFVEIGQDVQRAVRGHVEQGRGFVKRFVQDAKYVWDWKKSS